MAEFKLGFSLLECSAHLQLRNHRNAGFMVRLKEVVPLVTPLMMTDNPIVFMSDPLVDTTIITFIKPSERKCLAVRFQVTIDGLMYLHSKRYAAMKLSTWVDMSGID